MNLRKKPKFLRQSWRAYKRLKKVWRRPRGHQSKLRVREASHGKMPTVGYGAPKQLKYLHPSRFKEVLIKNLKDLEKVDNKTEAVKIAHTISRKKRQEILKRAEELKIKVLNP